MAIAWSRISSKVIATPLYAAEAYRRRCGNGTRHSDGWIPYMMDKRKQEVLGVRDAAVTLLSQARGGCVTCTWASFTRQRPSRSTGAHHVPKLTMHEKARQSQT